MGKSCISGKNNIDPNDEINKKKKVKAKDMI